MGGKLIESTLYSIEATINKTFHTKNKKCIDDDGVEQSDRQIKRHLKYRLAFIMATNFPNECKDLKPFLTKDTSAQAMEPKMDFLKWVESAPAEAEKMNRLPEFK